MHRLSLILCLAVALVSAQANAAPETKGVAASAAKPVAPLATPPTPPPGNVKPKPAAVPPLAPIVPSPAIKGPGGKAELAIQGVYLSPQGPYDTGAQVSVRATIRNSGNAPASVQLALMDARAPGGIGAESDPTYVAPQSTVSISHRIVIEPKKIRGDRFPVKLILLNSTVDRGRGLLGRAWIDGNGNDNQRDVALPVQTSAFDVTATLTGVTIHDNCWDDPRAVDRWRVSARVHRGGSNAWHPSGLEWPAHHVGPAEHAREIQRFPASGAADAADGSRWNPSLRFARPAVSRNEHLFLIADMIQPGDFKMGDTRLPGWATLVLAPEQWRRGGTFSTFSVRKRSDTDTGGAHIGGCRNGSWSATWQVTATPVALQ